VFGGGKADGNIGLASLFISHLTGPGSHLITPVNSKPNDAFTLCGIAVINARLGPNLFKCRILISR
jgi:hypothetical protein